MSKVEGFVLSDGTGTSARRATVPSVGITLGVEINAVVAHHSAKGVAQLKIHCGRAIAGDAPKVGIASRDGASRLGAVSVVGIGEQFGASQRVVAYCCLHSVVGIGQVGLKQVDVEREVGDAYYGVVDAWSHLPAHDGVGTILYAANVDAGMHVYASCSQH